MPSPTYFGRYRVLRAHAAGQMGTIFVAEDPLIGRSVAIKSLRLDPGSSAEDRERLQGRFERETRIAGTFSHPNIVTIFDVGRQAGQPFIVMEFVEGESLRERLDEVGLLPPREVARLIRPICEALDYAHERDVVHRDLKPSNVMLAASGEGGSVPKITDFGVAHLAGSDLTMSGKVFGAPSYMSPEQIRDEELTGASDQFAAGVVAYEMLTGRRPFAGAAAAQTIYQVVNDQPSDPREFNPDLSRATARVILKALHKNAGRRYPSCTAFAEALCEALEASVAVEAPAGSGSAVRGSLLGGLGRSLPARPGELFEALAARAEDGLERLRGRPGLAMATGVWLVVLLVAWGLAGGEGRGGGPEADGLGKLSTAASAEPGASTPTGSTPTGSTESRPTGKADRGPGPGEGRGPAEASGADAPGRPERPGEPGTSHGATALAGEAGLSPEVSTPDGGPAPAALPELPLQLTVASRPAGARVLLDGRPVGGVSPVTIRVADRGPHVLRLELAGHEPLAWRFRVGDLEERHLSTGELFFPLVVTRDAVGDAPPGEGGPGADPAGTETRRAFDAPVAPEQIRRVRAPRDVEVPRRTEWTPVELPEGLRDARGVVVVELEVNARGDVVRARLLRSLEPAVDRLVLDTVVGWRFAPTRVAGEPVNVLLTTTIRVGS